MLALSDSQMEAVMTAAADLPAEKRSVFLERVAAGCGCTVPALLSIRGIAGHDHRP
jgi:hypothetical protein